MLFLLSKIKSSEVATMDMDKFIEKLFDRTELKDIPVIYLCQVAISVLEIINEGECFYDSTATTDITG